MPHACKSYLGSKVLVLGRSQLYHFLKNKTNDHASKKYVRARKSDSTDDVENFIREYKQKRWVQNSERIGKADSLSAWYSVEELENFLALAKSNGGDGIRIFYGAFPENYSSET